MKRTVSLTALTAGAALVLSGCSFTGVNSYPLPFSKGGGGDAVSATVLLENSTNLVPNSEVKYGEVTIGSVRKIELDGWTAKLTVGLEADAKIPADVTAKVAQKSLLGAEYLELSDPAGEGPSATDELLADGDVIGLERTQRYPETEEVLTAASLLLNGGGLPQLQVISKEMNAALTGRNGDVTSLVNEVQVAASTLDAQRDQIFGAMEQLSNLSSTLNDDTVTLERALDTLPQGIQSLDENIPELTATLESFSRIEKLARPTLLGNAESFGEILNNLRPVTEALAGAGSDLPKVVELITYPFPAGSLYKYTRSDYLSLVGEVKISADEIAAAFLGINSLDGLLTGVLGNPQGVTVAEKNPLVGGLQGLAGTEVNPEKPVANGLLTQLLGGGSAPASPPAAGGGATPAPAPNLLQQLLGGQ